MGIKRDPADNWFSKCVRERTDYTCEVCFKSYDRSSTGLHCSHYHGRANKSVRWHGDNAFAHCFGCHQKMGANPHEFQLWAEKTLGSGRYDILTERKNDINMAKQMFKDNKAGHIAKHYKKQHAILSEKRNNGETEYLEFDDYC